MAHQSQEGPPKAEESAGSEETMGTSEETEEEVAGSRQGRGDEVEGRPARARAGAPDLCSNAAALLDVLSLPSMQQALQTPLPAPVEAARQIARLGTALGAPGNPGVQQLLLSLWEALEPAAAAEAAPSWLADLPRTLEGFDVEGSKAPALKALCRAFQLPLTGKKSDLQERLSGVLPLLPQRVPLRVALALQPDLARKIKARAALAALDAEPEGVEPPEGMYFFWGPGKIAATKAKTEFCLGDADLKDLPYSTGMNPISLGGPPMRLYQLKDVRRAALLRYGSAEGITEAQKKSAARGTAIRASKEEKRTARQAEAHAELEARGLSRLKLSSSIRDYVGEKRRGAKTLEAAIAGALQEEQDAREQAERQAAAARRRAEEMAEQKGRRTELLARLTQLGLSDSIGLPACQDYIKGLASSSGLQGVLDACVARQQRQQELLSSLREVGLEDSIGVSPCQAYILGGAGAGAELQAVVGVVVAQNPRRQELTAALAAQGLGANFCDTHDHCTAYIVKGLGIVPRIVRVVAEDHFYSSATRYDAYYANMLDFANHYDHDYPEDYPEDYEWWDEDEREGYEFGFNSALQDGAKEEALSKFVREHATLEACLADPRLPPHMEQAARDAWARNPAAAAAQQHPPQHEVDEVDSADEE